jgi:sugar phosphate isomerase/epimerase
VSLPRFSVSEFSTPNLTWQEDLAAFATGGAGGIGIAEAKLPDDDSAALAELHASGLKATLCLPATLSILPNAIVPDPADPEERIELLAGSIRRLAAYEPEMVMFLTGAPGDRDEQEARAIVVDGIRALGSVGRETGVRIGVEPIHRTANAGFSIITDLPAAEALLAEAGDDSVGILFDTWHLWDTPGVLDDARRLAPRFPAVHVNDWREETRDWDDRALPGEGMIDLPAIIGALEAGGYDGWYDLEIFSGEQYRDSLTKLDPAEMVRRGREGFVRAWEARG